MKDSRIAWTNHTFNSWIGCAKVSPGCQSCYAETGYGRRFGVEWGHGKPRRRTTEAYWRQPRAWDRRAAITGTRPLVFCASLADWLDPEVPPAWRMDLLDLIGQTPHLIWLLLTKRPEHWRRLVGEAADAGCRMANRWVAGDAPANVWAGATAEDRRTTIERVPRLLEIPAALRFLSVEPQLESIAPDLDGIDWVIVGGESGRGARPFDLRWARELRDRCAGARVPFFLKQLGDNPVEDGVPLRSRSRHGDDPRLWPADLRVRQFPDARGSGIRLAA